MATLQSHGIPMNPDEPGAQKWILEPECDTAVKLFSHLLEDAPIIATRTRRAYKQYVAGDIIGALKNYMAAAETGSVTGMANAAWLLERHCPVQKQDQWKCNRAGLRYWTEAGRF